jgi:hypothetical protein
MADHDRTLCNEADKTGQARLFTKPDHPDG